MMKKKIIITGITGRFGQVLKGRLHEVEYPILCLSRKKIHENYEAIYLDLADRDSLFSHIPLLKDRVEVIIHIASSTDLNLSYEFHHKNIYESSVNLYDFANLINCPKYLYFSSTGADLRNTFYSQLKWLTENRLLDLSREGLTKVLILRIGNIYSKYRLSFIGLILHILKKKNKIFYHRCKNNVMWSPIYVHDVIDCIFKIMEQKTFHNKIYYLTGNEKATLGDIAKIIANEIDMNIREMEMNFPQTLYFFFRKLYDDIRIAVGKPPFPDIFYYTDKDLDFIPKTSLADGIKNVLNNTKP